MEEKSRYGTRNSTYWFFIAIVLSFASVYTTVYAGWVAVGIMVVSALCYRFIEND